MKPITLNVDFKEKSGIYCLENIITGDKYIGSSINLFKRRREHFYQLKTKVHGNIRLQVSYEKHGKDNFIFYVIEPVEDKHKLIEREQHYIDLLKPKYNICKKADSSLGVKRSKETKDKVRLANLGLKHPEWRNKIKSKAQGGDNHWTRNKRFSEDSKERMKKAQLKLYASGYVHPNKKPIIQYTLQMEFLKEWESAAEIERVLGILKSSICQCAKGTIKSSRSFIWRYKE